MSSHSGSGRTRRTPWLLFLAALAAPAGAAVASPIADVSVSPAFFNPSLGQSATIRLRVDDAGVLEVSIVDRDGFVVRSLGRSSVEKGPRSLVWDGKDDEGRVVPDEAYSLRISIEGARGRGLYDPRANHVPTVFDGIQATYARTSGVLGYELPRPSRVHILAGQADGVDSSGRTRGPVLKVIAERQPRVGGRVIEMWNGMDESGRVYVPDLPHFAVGILATDLPENSLITVGNRQHTYVDYAESTRPAGAVTPRALPHAEHAHHRDLNAFEDRSPRLSLELERGSNGDPSGLRVALEERAARHFLTQATNLYVFAGEKQIAHIESPANPALIELPPGVVGIEGARIVANWGSPLGPVAVGVLNGVRSDEGAHQGDGGAK